MRRLPLILSVVIVSAFINLETATAQFTQTNLSSDIPGLANFTDPNLKNPWGLSATPTSPFWSANEQAGNSTLHTGSGSLANPTLIPAVPGGPTGTVFNSGNTAGAFNGDLFLFATHDGGLAGWRPALGLTNTEVLSTPSGNTYTGLAAATIGTNTYAYLANFTSGHIDVFRGDTATPFLPGNFTDPNLPSGFRPFNVQVLGGQLFATYFNPLGPPGQGIVDIFDVSGNFIQRIGGAGILNDPWGLAIAPLGFGSLGGDLLVGNHTDGSIWAFDLNGALIGELKDAQGNPILNPGLWALMFGNNGPGFDPGALYLNIGLNGGVDGLFAEIQSTTPIPAALPLFASGAGVLAYFGWRRKRKRITA